MNPEESSEPANEPPPSDRFVFHKQGSDATFLAHGAAANVWLLARSRSLTQRSIAPTPRYEYRPGVSSEAAGPSQAPTGSSQPTNKFVSKCIRISPESMISYRRGPSSESKSEIWRHFVQKYKTQASRWFSIDHKNVIKVLKFEQAKGLNLLTEYCPNGTVRAREWPTDLRIYDIVHSVAAGLRHLHELEPPIIHGNLNAGKVYIAESNVVKVGEFGLAMLAQEFATLAPTVSLAGITRWMSPELLDNEDDSIVPTTSSDIWALGCTIYEIVSAKLPYSDCIHDVQIIGKIKEGVAPGAKDDQVVPGLSHLWPVIEDCWTVEPEQRPTAFEITLNLRHVSLDKAVASTSTSPPGEPSDEDAPYIDQLNYWTTHLGLQLSWDSSRSTITRTWTTIAVVEGYPLAAFAGTGRTNTAAQADVAERLVTSGTLQRILDEV